MIMTKTIEEAARDYAANANVTSENFCPEDITDAFENGAWYVKDLPLRDRLTEAEKERVREEYADNKCLIESASLSYVQREVFQKINETLEHIFGADFFKEGE